VDKTMGDDGTDFHKVSVTNERGMLFEQIYVLLLYWHFIPRNQCVYTTFWILFAHNWSWHAYELHM